MIDLVAFLGNPGRKYARNRHNAGFLLAEKTPLNNALSWQNRFRGFYAFLDRSRIAEYLPESESLPPDGRVHFIKPETFMNLSGESVSAAASFYKIEEKAILVIHDELELPLGTVSLKFSGGLGGHNGLRSMKACFGNADFWRLRIGIGRPDSRLPGEGGPPGSGEGIVDWVLSNFDPADTGMLDKVFEMASGLLLRAVMCDPETLLKEWGKKKVSIEPVP